MKAGINSLAYFKPTLSAIVNPLSAITMSPGSNWSRNPECSVRYLSEVRPPQASLTNDTVPWGVIPMRILIVLWCLYDENVCALANI